ncbi:general secretion pathway protein GspM [Rhodanobacter sp. C06]|uniref:type II secretion system protein GspM n=1 Tax=Rhodanobacter sp. C06 TaxID=1945854 RepID=UPI0009873800|nr:type II secretion system protein GspM [Rhodanobacter sp. C06]OOG44245.1 general secretion pathway protein GspM [Rhodanobacter sp. C06]
MKALKLSPRDSRIAALGLLLLALLLAYFLLLHWWFVAPLRDIAAQMDDLRDTQSRYAAAIAEQPQLRQRIAALGAGQAASSAFLPEDDPNTAAADLMQRVVDAVGAHTEGGSCTVTQKMPVPNPQVTSGEPYRKAAVSINLSCDIEPLVSVLQALEQGTPYLFVDNLNVYRNPVAARQGNGPSLEVQFTLSGYVRPGGATPAAAASAPAPDDAADEAGATP